jgi:hypothetical protein
MALLISCGGGDDTPAGGDTPGTGDNPGTGNNPGGEITLLDFEGITLKDLTVTYDGEEHSVTVEGNLPEGTVVTYTSNKATNAGTYNATAKLECEGYNTATLTATLTVNKADISGITLEGKSVEYDTKSHSITVVGNVPAGATVTYTYNGVSTDSVSEVGEYTVVATVGGNNFNPLTLTATLKIKSTESLLYAVSFGGGVYFQNDLDGKRLYVYKNGQLSKVNNDVAEQFFVYGGELY